MTDETGRVIGYGLAGFLRPTRSSRRTARTGSAAGGTAISRHPKPGRRLRMLSSIKAHGVPVER